MAPEERARNLVPNDTTSLAGIDLGQLQGTSFYLRHQSSLRVPVPPLADQTGFDPNRDLKSLMLCWNGKDALLIGEGAFQEKKIKQQLASHSVERNYEGRAVFEIGSYAFSILDDKTVLAGNSRSVEQAIGSARSGGKEGVPEALDAALKQLPSADQVWVVSRGTLPFADFPMRSDYASILANFRGYVRTAAVGLAIDTGFHLRARVDCISSAGSRRVYDALRAGVGLGRLSAKDREPELARVYDSLRSSQQGSLVFVQADLSPELADALFARAMRLDLRASTSRLH